MYSNSCNLYEVRLYEVSNNIIFIHMKKLKQKRVKSLTKGYTARRVGRRVRYFARQLTCSKSQNWDLNLGILELEEMWITKEE